ncbi:ABC transporter permease [Cellulomonas xiejunii]|uniref:ABC transporter permease n=1 Tax=Cellulomonas xiejunii TaxID=2968083 RepID=A0ABY5KWB4_9CELL|nr:ABC transporter permease [Cellulomonas xiejunii]MCC2323041.1 ABC transporter permease [Cellulomonas xiejunii]UUI73537.1 ABC transporter permease [Cellulomonas xiejunii]
MIRYLARRGAQALATIYAVVTLAFVFGRLSGSPAVLILGENASPEQIAALDAELGFDRPVTEQYLAYLGGVLRGDFGASYRERGTSSMDLVLERLPLSLHLGAWGLGLGLALAFLVVLVTHLTGWWPLRTVALALGSMRQSTPDFFFGLLLVIVLAVQLGLLPSLGASGPAALVMPALTIATGQFVVYARLLDNSLVAQSSMDYVRTARARGEGHSRVLLGEVLPNALLPVMTVAGINLGTFLGGLVIVENVFAWPGLGQLMLSSVYARDFPVVQSALVVVALLFVAANLLVDLVSSLVDPRVRLR